MAACKSDEKKTTNAAPKYTAGSCCAVAAEKGTACTHPCCVDAAKAGKVCASCNK